MRKTLFAGKLRWYYYCGDKFRIPRIKPSEVVKIYGRHRRIQR